MSISKTRARGIEVMLTVFGPLGQSDLTPRSDPAAPVQRDRGPAGDRTRNLDPDPALPRRAKHHAQSWQRCASADRLGRCDGPGHCQPRRAGRLCTPVFSRRAIPCAPTRNPTAAGTLTSVSSDGQTERKQKNTQQNITQNPQQARLKREQDAVRTPDAHPST